LVFLSYLRRTPPHIAMVFGKHYYSYDLQKFDKKIPLEKILNFFKKKEEAVIGLELIGHPVYTEHHMEEMYACWHPEEEASPTCLSPVLDFLKTFYHIPLPAGKRPNIPETLSLLLGNALVQSVFFFNFKEEKQILIFDDYDPAQTQRLIEQRYVSEGQ
ncbi:MAG: hypothetical protein N3F09_03115, partial [Bacteroidia bacterium]|nr:hypothetical protein [Bacteroidia bacterium]